MTHLLLSVQNSYEQNFFSREFRGISELYKVGITQKKAHQHVLTRDAGTGVHDGGTVHLSFEMGGNGGTGALT